MDLSPKVLAYLRAAEVVKKARTERGYDRATTAAINHELKVIAGRLHKSAQNAYNGEVLNQVLANDPDLAQNYKGYKEARRYFNAKKTVECIKAKVDEELAAKRNRS